MDLNNMPKKDEFPFRDHLRNKEEFIDQGGFVEASKDVEEPASFQIYYNQYLGGGNFNSVYVGKFLNKLVAVKEMKLVPSDRERIQHQMAKYIGLEHENVLKLWDVSSSHYRFTFLILDLCAGTIKDFCEKKYEGPMPPDEVVFLQIVSGVEYIHSQNLIHRDIKPTNVLISQSSPVQMKVSELTFERKKISDIFNLSETKDMPFWMATELLEQLNSFCELQDETTATDTFSTGCVLFYFATRGTHPYGNSPIYAPVNILNNNPVEFISLKKNLQDNDRVLYDLIERMIRKKEERIALSDVKKELFEISAKLTFDSPNDKMTTVDYAVSRGVDLK